MAIDDEKFKKAMLEGDWSLLDEMEMSDDEEADETEAENDEAEDDSTKDHDDDSANEGEGDKPDSKDAVSEDGKKKDITAGDTSAPADIAEGIESKITFDDNGNAIVPKELLAIIAKNGKHEIPYGVLESTRAKAKEASSALEQERLLRQEAEGKLTKNDRQAALLKKQLESAGIDPEQLPEDIELTPELLESLDEYGDVGKVLKALVGKQGIVKEQSKQEAPKTEAQPDQQRFNDYKAYVAKRPEFKAIMDNEGSDEQETLEHFYTQVTNSSSFKDKPLSVQLDEVLARTNRAIGKEPEKPTDNNDEIKAIAAQKAKQAMENQTPASPSEIGHAESGKGNALERARAATGSDLIKIMDELTPKELDALLDDMD